MFERFSKSSIEVLRLARKEAHAMGSECIASEHVLLALLQQPDSATSDILSTFKVDIAKVRIAIKELAQYPCDSHDHPAIDSLEFTPLCQRAFHAVREGGAKFNETGVMPDHVLLAILREKDCLALEVLRTVGIGIDELLQQVEARMESGGKPPSHA